MGATQENLLVITSRLVPYSRFNYSSLHSTDYDKGESGVISLYDTLWVKDLASACSAVVKGELAIAQRLWCLNYRI
jgi:hypothetical protein